MRPARPAKGVAIEMLMQFLPPEERKGESRYIRGSFVHYDDRPTDEQQQEAVNRAKRWGDRISTCVVCGRLVTGRKKYCSQRCVNDAYMERRRQRHAASLRKTCAVCGKPFTAKRTDAMYCSPACKQAAYRGRVTDNRSAKIGTTDSGNVTDNRCALQCSTDSGNALKATGNMEA